MVSVSVLTGNGFLNMHHVFATFTKPVIIISLCLISEPLTKYRGFVGDNLLTTSIALTKLGTVFIMLGFLFSVQITVYVPQLKEQLGKRNVSL